MFTTVMKRLYVFAFIRWTSGIRIIFVLDIFAQKFHKTFLSESCVNYQKTELYQILKLMLKF